MNKIFVDANIIVDYLDSSAADNALAVNCLRIIRKHFGKPVVSPVTFIIVNYLLGKLVKNKKWHKKQMQLVFSEFEMTPLHAAFINHIFNSEFIDLEDAIQYQCTLSSKAKVIITKDIYDFFASGIPVVHPNDFVIRYNKLLH